MTITFNCRSKRIFYVGIHISTIYNLMLLNIPNFCFVDRPTQNLASSCLATTLYILLPALFGLTCLVHDHRGSYFCFSALPNPVIEMNVIVDHFISSFIFAILSNTYRPFVTIHCIFHVMKFIVLFLGRFQPLIHLWSKAAD